MASKNENFIHYVKGDLFTCPDHISLAHCISADAKLGKGIALIFRKKYGGIDEILSQGQRPGGCAVLKRGKRYIYNLVTKERYFDKPTYTSLENSLKEMCMHCRTNNVTEISMPKIGSGLDRLDWYKVKRIIEDVFVGCKSFFKRSIRRNLAYSCRAFQNCPVDINHRNQCQYCRLKKCVRVGMRKDAVQKGRLPKSPLEGSMVDQLVTLNQQQQQQQHIQPQHSPQVLSPYATMLLRADNIGRLQQQQQQNSYNFVIGNENEVATRLLKNAVEWARNVPLFSALPASDQIALLKSSWSDLYILNTSQHCSTYQIKARSLVTSSLNDNVMQDHTKRVEETMATNYSFKIFEDLVEKFKSLHTDHAEFSCLKALVLFNPDSPGITNPALIESLQEKAQLALEDYLRHHAAPNYENRFGKLLLRLPALSLLRPNTVEALFFSRLLGNQNIDNLVGSWLVYGTCNNNNNNNSNNNNMPIFSSNGVQTNNNFNAVGINMNTTGSNGQLGGNMTNSVNGNHTIGNLSMLALLNGQLGNFTGNSAIGQAINSVNLQNALQNTLQMQFQPNAGIGLNSNMPNNLSIGLLNHQPILCPGKLSNQNFVTDRNDGAMKSFIKTESPSR